MKYASVVYVYTQLKYFGVFFCARRRHKISFNLESKADSNERWFHRFFETNMQFVCKKMNFLQYEHEK